MRLEQGETRGGMEQGLTVGCAGERCPKELLGSGHTLGQMAASPVRGTVAWGLGLVPADHEWLQCQVCWIRALRGHLGWDVNWGVTP